MPRWPLLLPPPAVSTSTSPSRSRGSSSSIIVDSLSCRPSPSSCRRCRAVPRCCAAPSITLYLPSRRSSPPIAAALTPSLAVEEPSRRPSPSRSRCAIAVEEPSGAVGCVDRRLRPLVTLLPGLSSGWLSRCLSSLRRLPSAGASHCGIAFRASLPSSWLSRLLASHAATSHLPAPPPLITPSPLVTPLSGLSSSWLRRRLSSRRHQKTVHERQEKVERNAMIIQAAKGGDVTKLTRANLTVLLTWYQHANVAKMKKNEKPAAWVVIVSSGRARALVVVIHVIKAYSWY